MNPKQLGLMTHPATGRVLIVLNKPRQPPQGIKDVTRDYVLMLAAEIMAEDAGGIERVFTATDPAGNEIEVTLTARITGETKKATP